jgi:hypothetical protein
MLVNIEYLNSCTYRDAENISGEKGEEIVKTVWRETLDALQKDFPKVRELVNGK